MKNHPPSRHDMNKRQNRVMLLADRLSKEKQHMVKERLNINVELQRFPNLKHLRGIAT